MKEDQITEEDLRTLRLFQFKHTYFLSQSAFNAIPFVFPEIHIPSIKSTRSRIKFLSGVEVSLFDCCINSCCCFVGGYKDNLHCPFCNEPRYIADGKTARKSYRYTALIPRLRGIFENKTLSKELLYRHNYELQESPSGDGCPDDYITVADIWDGKVYKDLKKRHIKVNNEELAAKYFSDEHDIALGLSTDGLHHGVNASILCGHY